MESAQAIAVPQDEATLDQEMYRWLLNHPYGRRFYQRLRRWTGADAAGSVMGLEALASRDAMRAISDTIEIEAQQHAPDEWIDMKHDQLTAARMARIEAAKQALQKQKEA